MIHVCLGVLGLVGLARALWCAWQMHAPSASLVHRTVNAGMGAVSCGLLWVSIVSMVAPR